MKRIYKTPNPIEINAIQAMLESEGIKTFLFDPTEGGSFFSSTGRTIELEVNDEDAEHAGRLIKEYLEEANDGL